MTTETHAPDGMHLPALDSDAWVAFLDAFLEGFPDLHLEVQDTAADAEMNSQRILFTGTPPDIPRSATNRA